MDCLDERFLSLAISLGAREIQYSALIRREVLERAEYPQAFPHLLMSVNQPPGPAATGCGQWCLSPAVCYHTYAELAGRLLDRPAVVTARGRCFRAERECVPGVRQVEFEMREIVLAGPAEWIDTSIASATAALEQVAAELFIQGCWEDAEDPFFLPAAAGKAVLQRLLRIKVEYRSPGPRGVALASVNRHRRFFSDRFQIAMADATPLHTACIAMGLDRWLHRQRTAAVIEGRRAQ
jgi:hypothetical protein